VTHGELFAGISGFGIAFERAGIPAAWRVEIDPNCQKVLKHHYPGDLLLSDIHDCGAHNLDPVDIITFGSPCQDMSVAGKRAGLNGKRSGLFYEAIRIVGELEPTFAIWENVPGAFSSNAGRDFLAVIAAFRELGACDVAWRVLNAQYFGVPQRRRRIFLIADFGGERAGEILFESESLQGDPPESGKAGERIAGAVTGGVDRPLCGFEGENLIAFRYKAGAKSGSMGEGKVSPTLAAGQPFIGITAPLTSGGGGGRRQEDDHNLVWQAHPKDACRISENGLSPTLSGYMGTGGNNTPMVGVRRLTPLECERLQGFPSGWTDICSDSARYRMLGNAAAVPVVEWIARRIPQ